MIVYGVSYECCGHNNTMAVFSTRPLAEAWVKKVGPPERGEGEAWDIEEWTVDEEPERL